MRLRCPSCNGEFSAKASSRNIKCPKCGLRDQAPADGWEASPGWRKGKVGKFERIEVKGQMAGSPGSANRVVFIVVGAVLVLAVAGAAWYMMKDDGGMDGVPTTTPGAVEIDLITPGTWKVSSVSESMFVWVHNNGTGPLDYSWSLTGPGGAALPDGWSATFQTPSGTLQPGGSKGPDWQGTLVLLHVPPSQAAGQVQAELHAGGGTRAFTFDVTALGTVITPGTVLMTHYDLRKSNGEQVQEGDFCLTAAGTEAVTAYSQGVVGLALGETVTLVVPPAFAYGFGGGQLSNQVLLWTTTAVRTLDACPAR